MRKFLISAAAAVTALAVAAPAAAQWQQPYYGNGYGNGYGYNNNYGHVRRLQVRLNNIERQINRLDNRNVLSEREAARLRWEANRLERQIRVLARNGLNQYEFRNVQIRLAQLEQRVQYEARDGNRWGYNDNRNRWGDRDGWSDRDRDNRNDRYEDDRGYDHD